MNMLLAGTSGEQHFFARKDCFMRLRIQLLVCLCAALSSPVAFAEPLPTPVSLGQMESLLDSCSKVNPSMAPELKKQRERLVQSVSERDIAQVRAANEYKAVYKEFSERLATSSKDDAKKACKVFSGTAETPAQVRQ